jgi:phage tail sheath protein FI
MREQELLSLRGVNAIRSFEGRGIRVWGARTLSTDAEWKYVNVRRLFIFLERSLFEGTRWATFEPNNEQLWTGVRNGITQFLADLWQQGAFTGTRASDAFWVKCDQSTMTQQDISEGRLICEIGVAAVRPAEFIVFRIVQQTSSGA